MPNKVDRLRASIKQLSSEIAHIQSNCTHEMKTGGLLYSVPSDKILMRFNEEREDWFCHPTITLDRISEGVFSIDRCFIFYVQCKKCDKKEERFIHQICFFCLGDLGEETVVDGASSKECSLCRIGFVWHRIYWE